MHSNCPICAGAETTTILSRTDMPVLMNRLYPTRAAARAAPRGKLDFVACTTCGFTWNRAFDPALVTYDDSYENDVTHSPVFQRHLSDRAADVVASVAGDIDYVEIGCGQGHFIAALAQHAGSRLRSAEGFDPAWRGATSAGPAGSRLHKTYFTAGTRLERSPNLVVSRHTIEHVPDPLGFLTDIRTALGPTSRAQIFVETPCIGWSLAHRALQDFFYEHCSLFTARSLALALTQAGFEGAEIAHVYGGQYLWARAQAGQLGSAPSHACTEMAHALAQTNILADWSARTQAAMRRGPVAVWGAGAKGVSFAQSVDPAGTLIDHVVDINPGKQGHFLPGSGVEVLAPDRAAARGAKTIFVMNDNYLAEITDAARHAGMNAALETL